MVKFYLRQIEKGTIMLEDVPPKWYEEVKAELERSEEMKHSA